MSDSNENQDVSKTFVEGSDAQQTGIHSLKTKSRLDATSIRGANPYESQTASNLPSGNEPLPLGSGSIVGLLGSGGMAKVYKIWNEKLEVFRAVKILIPNQQGDLRNRFETEAKITAKLHHTNIVEIYNVGDWQNLPYLEMELIDGQSLEAIIQKTGRLSPIVCSSIAIFVARALAYAHSQEFLIYGKTYKGIIHRDLKPANIMISSQGLLKLMDFGIARPTEASLHTVEGNIVGTMQYLSPEQLDGIDVDNRADIYAFGAILYEMLTGTKTFPQETITNLMKQKIVNEYRKFDDFDFGIPSALTKITQKCLQLSKENRYTNANMLLKELETAHKSLTPESPENILKTFITDPSSIPESSIRKSFLRLNPKILIPAAGVLLVGGLVTFFLMTGPKNSRETQQKVVVAVPPPQPQTQQPANATAPVEQLQKEKDNFKPLARQDSYQQKQQPVEQVSNKLNVRHSGSSSLKADKTPKEKKTDTKEPDYTEKKQNVSPLELLKKKYESNDCVAIGIMAIQKNEFSEAITALSAVGRSDANHEKAVVLLLNAYIESGRMADAQSITQNETINDAQFYFLCGKLLQKQEKNRQALEFFQTALTKPCIIRNIGDVRMDAIYYTALTWRDIYISDPTPDNKGMVLQSWLVVKNAYRNNPSHQRFKKAVEEMASIN
ncbi:MAG TPA: hypothetical protein DCO75_05300 [Fibrobacteres bacterium]|nr:hypothetical protein [Fibrobacterota bacterium]